MPAPTMDSMSSQLGEMTALSTCGPSAHSEGERERERERGGGGGRERERGGGGERERERGERGRERDYYYNLIIIPYSRKYWRKLNLAVEPKIAIARILADLNLAVRYGITIHILYASRKFWQIFNLAVVI